MAITNLADDFLQGIFGLAGALTGADQTIRLGVTGLSRAGKTVFITGLVSNLLDRARMAQFAPQREGRILAVHLQPQPDDTVPRFAYEDHLAALTGDAPAWPASTRAVSELRLSIRYQPSGMLGGLSGARLLHLDIIDYPGEWLLDLALLDKDYTTWSDEALDRLVKRPEAAEFMALARAEDGSLPLSEPKAQALAQSYTHYLTRARAAGWSDCTPGRFLLPGDLAGSPALTFAPIPKPASTPRGSLWREMERRYEAYKSRVIKPFFSSHFARLDRQIVLADVLGAIHGGPQSLEDMRRTLAEVLAAFRPGRNGWLTALFGGKRIDRILFAATKADHLHHLQHPALTAITEALLTEARARAELAGAEVMAMSLAGVRATVEEMVRQGGTELPAVKGRLAPDGRLAAMYPGQLPESPTRLLSPARQGAEKWLDADYALMSFLPARARMAPGEGLPHIRLDRAIDFLIGDRM
jgi:predicted YcjX-like family ATPase